jgi:uncharacterized protein YbjT (DUF2867 family)
MYVITGATGNTGSRIATILLSRGKKVRAVARNRNKLSAITHLGAEIAAGSVDDQKFLTDAFQGATAVYTLIPPDFQQKGVMAFMNRAGEAIAAALKAANVRNVVFLSSIGAELPSGTGPIAGLHNQEQRLNQLDANVLHLRPSFFMENFLGNIPMIREMGILGSPARADLSMPIIATKDIGTYAADRLDRLDFNGKSVAELHGPKNYTHEEVATILGNAIGKPNLKYIPFSYEDGKNGMIQGGLSQEMAELYIEMYRAMNEDLIKFQKRTPENTTPTTLEDFAAEVFAPAFKSS